MTWPPFFPSFNDLSQTLPIFPLTGVLLLPRGQLPLNIFEPRYIAMIDDALSSDRLIGMIQPVDATANGAAPEVYSTGCAGRITTFDETDDGRYLITLTGLCRFNLEEEVSTTRGYRRVKTDWSPFRDDMAPAEDCLQVDRDRLRQALSVYFNRQGISANWDAIEGTPDDRLVTSLAMICPFAACEKQALLEAPTPQERAALLLSLIEMAAIDNQGSDTPRH